MLKCDFHMHTNFVQKKGEGNYTPEQLIDEAVKKGFDVICITEHYLVAKGYPLWYKDDPFKTFRHVKEYADKKGILLLPGVEINIDGGDVLLVNFFGDYTRFKNFSDLKKVPDNCLVVAPHPYFIFGPCLGKNFEKHHGLFDAVEYNYFYLTWLNRNKKAVNKAKEFGLPIVGNSDCHRLFQLGRVYSLVDAKKDADSIIAAVKGGRVKIVKRPLPFYLFFLIFIKSLVNVFINAGCRLGLINFK